MAQDTPATVILPCGTVLPAARSHFVSKGDSLWNFLQDDSDWLQGLSCGAMPAGGEEANTPTSTNGFAGMETATETVVTEETMTKVKSNEVAGSEVATSSTKG
ncbi:hypothetical protein K440DRAFT_619837 [Wilcoxina mikolae CBS 423.85]|nr:hypothetical protein K440DRAFT_619837 [Wilcoxina mikolae CBS 423.85]